MCNKQTFEKVTRSIFEEVSILVQQNTGVSLDKDKGQSTEQGYTIDWEYIESDQSLTITCKEKPPIIPCFVISGKINDMMRQARIAVEKQSSTVESKQ